MTPDARLLKGEFCDPRFSLDKTYLQKYFQSNLSICFVKYFIEFEDIRKQVTMWEFCKLFTDHTGHSCEKSHKHYLYHKITELLEAEKLAIESFDLDKLSSIKNGKYKFKTKY